MFENLINQATSLARHTRIKPGGLSRIIFFKIEDVQTWPELDPVTGVITTNLVLREGASFFTFEATNRDNVLEESSQSGNAGPYIEISVRGKLAGNSENAIMSLDAMKHHQFALLVTDKNGEMRLIGDEDSGADMAFSYTSSDGDGSRMNIIRWNWEHSRRAPIYCSDEIVINDVIFEIENCGCSGGSGGSGGGSGLNEVVPFENEPTLVLPWNAERITRFGDAGVFNVYIAEGGVLRRTEMIEVIADDDENPTSYSFDFGGPATGVIIIS